MPLRLEARPQPSAILRWLSPPIAVLLTVATGAVLFAALGYDPRASLQAFFVSPISTGYGLAELGVKAAPLVIIACGLALGFRAGIYNIGAEGQLTIGAIAGGGVALLAFGAEGPWTLPAMVLAGVLGGMAYAAIPAFLRVRFQVSEILVSLMLTYIALLFLSYLVYGPWKNPQGFNFPETRLFGATLPILVEGTRLHLGAAVALLVVLAIWFVTARTLLGFQLRTMGAAPEAARYAGFRGERLVYVTLMTSGGLAGMAGVFEVSGPIGQLVPEISPGYGFTAIIVAFLGKLHPLGILLAGIVIALSYIGGENAQIEVGLPQAVTGVFQGMLLFFLLAVDACARFRPRRVCAPAATAAE